MQNTNYTLKNTTVGCIVILILIFPYFSLHLLPQAQPQFPEFQRFALADGLPDLNIHAIFQDKFGFLWLGTDNGLVRYDGYKMVTYKPNPEKQETSIKGRIVKAICEDNERNLWVGTEDGGLNRYDRKKDTFSLVKDIGIRFLHIDRRGIIWYISNEEALDYIPPDGKKFNSITSSSYKIVRAYFIGTTFYTFHEDQQGMIWFGLRDGGLVCFNPETGSSILITGNQGERDKAEIIRDICEDNLGTLWISTENGRLKYLKNRGKNEFTCIEKVAGNQLPPWQEKPIWKLFPDSKNRLWLTTKEGLFCFEPGSGKILHHFKNIQGDENSLNDNVSAPIYEDKHGRLWLISWGDKSGIQLLNPDTGKIRSSSLSNSMISSHLEDDFGALWIGTEAEGLFKRKELQPFEFPHYLNDPGNANSLDNDNVTVIYASPSNPGIFWIGTEKGLNKFDGKTSTFSRIDYVKSSPNGLTKNKVTALCEDNWGMLWIGTVSTDKTKNESTGRLGKYDPNTKTFTLYRLQPDDSISGWANNWVTVMLKEKDGMIWVGTRYSGLYLFDPDKGNFIQYKNEINNSKVLSDNDISVIYEDNRATLWIGTFNGGLNRFNKSEKNFVSYFSQEMGFTTITAIHEDRSGNFWIGTKGGFHLFDRTEAKVVKFFTEREGLPNDFVNSIKEDNQGYLWIISGNNFLSKLNPQNMKFLKHFGSSDGLWETDSIDVALMSRENDLFIGGKNGFRIFSPRDLKENDIPPKVVLTSFNIYGKQIPVGGSSPLKERISTTEEITLSYDQNDISIDFAVLHFSQPDRNRSQYILENYDKLWRTAGAIGTAMYNNLPPGDYTFRIKGANSDGFWSSKEKSFFIIIKPPFWDTWWFRMPVLFLVLVIIMLYLLNRARIKQIEIIRQRRTLENEVNKQTEALRRTEAQLFQSEKMAALGNLTAGIAHEIKNPLNFVVNFAELSVNLSEKLHKELGKEKDKLASNSYNNLSQILAKLEQNLDRIQEHGNRIDSIVSGMLLHSRGKKGEFHEVDLNNLIKDNTELVYHSLRARNSDFNVRIGYELDKAIGTVRVVPQDFSRAILNILNNACYAANEKRKDALPEFSPTVTVRTKNHETTFEIIIRDNGNGIPESDIKRIFAPYFTTKPVGEGTGLGLSIVHDIITREHQGDIKVASVEKEFTEFIITIPKHLEIKETGINS